jgi:hypothetical protein
VHISHHGAARAPYQRIAAAPAGPRSRCPYGSMVVVIDLWPSHRERPTTLKRAGDQAAARIVG